VKQVPLNVFNPSSIIISTLIRLKTGATYKINALFDVVIKKIKITISSQLFLCKWRWWWKTMQFVSVYWRWVACEERSVEIQGMRLAEKHRQCEEGNRASFSKSLCQIQDVERYNRSKGNYQGHHWIRHQCICYLGKLQQRPLLGKVLQFQKMINNYVMLSIYHIVDKQSEEIISFSHT